MIRGIDFEELFLRVKLIVSSFCKLVELTLLSLDGKAMVTEFKEKKMKLMTMRFKGFLTVKRQAQALVRY